jgi:hypothetical protein
VISEKSIEFSRAIYMSDNLKLTLSVQEVAHWNHVATFISKKGGLFKHPIYVRVRTDTHVFLSEMLHMSIDICILLCAQKSVTMLKQMSNTAKGN